MRARLLELALLTAFLFPVSLGAQAADDEQVREHFQAAQRAEKTGDYATAAAEYQTVLKLRPELAEVHTNLGLVYYLQGKNDEAIKALQRALELRPDILGANLFLGTAYVRTNQYEKSLDPLNPKEARAYLNLGLSYSELGRDDEALTVLRKAAELFPRDVEVLYSLGRVYTKLMTSTYEKMDQIDPDSYRAHQLLGAYYEARRDPRAAAEEYKTAIAKKPDAPELHYALGNIYWKNKEFDQAEAEFRKELQIAPENYLATWKLGNVYVAKRQYDQAFLYLRTAVRQKPDLGQAYRDLGRALIQTGDFAGAIVQLEKVNQLDPDEPATHYLLAQAYRKLGRTKEEKAELDRFAKLREAEQERNRRPDIMVSGSQDKTEEEFPEDPGLSKEPE